MEEMMECLKIDGNTEGWRLSDLEKMMECLDIDGNTEDGRLSDSGTGEDGSGSGAGRGGDGNPQETRKQAIERCIASLEHACRCHDADCRQPSCRKMKRVMAHTRECRPKTKPGTGVGAVAGRGTGKFINCSICRQLLILCCFHSKDCTESGKCLVLFCGAIKERLRHLGLL